MKKILFLLATIAVVSVIVVSLLINSVPLVTVDIENAIVYERLNDDRPKRTITDYRQIVRDTNADMIFRATWRWKPMPKSCDVFSQSLWKEMCIESGYSTEQLQSTIVELKTTNPEIIIVGAVPAQRINQNLEYNDKTGKVYNSEQTWNMAIDPTKWGITEITKEQFQGSVSGVNGYYEDGYYPDITNPEYQDLLMGIIENQIDAGANAIWIDMLYNQAVLFAKITGDVEHNSVKDSYNSASEIVNKIHVYGLSKGKYIYVGSWSGAMYFPYTHPKFDFITVSPQADEVRSGKFNGTMWDAKIAKINTEFSDVPIFAFIDWAGDGSPMAIFSQELSSNEQSDFLRTADEFFTSQGVIFIQPVHGGYLGPSARLLAYNEYGCYDSMAPEFQTYDTIKELCN